MELIARFHVRLLITDYNMRGMDGLQLIQSVKKVSPQTGTVLITAYDTPELWRRVGEVGVDDYLSKPFPLDGLMQIVSETVAAHRCAPA